MSKENESSSIDRSGARTITLDRPSKANALGARIVEELLCHVAAAAADGTQVIVLKGNGKNFCAGFDFSGYADQSDGDLVLRFVRIEELLQAIRYAPFVTIACVQGAAFGAGADLVASCTYRFGDPSARFRFPGFQFGVALGTRHLARIVGTSRARDILLNNKQLDAAQALECGLLTHAVSVDEFDRAVQGIVESTSQLRGNSLRALLRNTLDDTRDRELAELVRSVSAPGLRGRIEKYRGAVAV